MAPFTPFVDRETGEIDTEQIFSEAIPLAKLIALFGAVAYIPLALISLLGLPAALRTLFTVAAQFILAVGTGIILLYIIIRAMQMHKN